MPAAKKTTSVSVELENPQAKKNVTRYDADENDTDAAMSNAYISKSALAKIGNPDKIKVTIEAV